MARSYYTFFLIWSILYTNSALRLQSKLFPKFRSTFLKQVVDTTVIDDTGKDPIVNQTHDEILKIKAKLFSLCTTCDRGFASTKKDNEDILNLVESLKQRSPLSNPTQGLYPNNNNSDSLENVPIEGVWKLAYTTAFDVLSLAGNPITQLQGIYQVISADGSSVNIIDSTPRLQTILPISLSNQLSTVTRAMVYTSAYARSATRVGLTFKRVALKQQSLLGYDLNTLPFQIPKLSVTFPDVSLFGLNNNSDVNSPGYFDILYLDDNLLIISQNEPGGIFINIKDTTQSISDFLTE